ncbi:hypothetical protein SynRS9915_02759 [Synechococcus sp. RS9915]|nr:hypothetical protein SynRS9915_02759 [Synechococcus sp. RS9915]
MINFIDPGKICLNRYGFSNEDIVEVKSVSCKTVMRSP